MFVQFRSRIIGKSRSRMLLSVFTFLSFSMLSLVGCQPLPVVDQPASELDVQITVTDPSAKSTDNKVLVSVQFLFNGAAIQLGGDAQASCNGTSLGSGGFLGYTTRIAMENVGGKYTIEHTRAGVTSKIEVAVPGRPVITSPKEGDTLERSKSFSITYTAGNGKSVRAGASDSSTGLSGDSQADNGEIEGFDVSSLKAGKGVVSVLREVESTVSPGGFKSVKVSYHIGAEVGVTWK